MNENAVKAKNHRKRHVMAGPAGVWFQQQQSSSCSTILTENPGPSNHENASSSEHKSQSSRQQETVSSAAFSSAWMILQRDLHVPTSATNSTALALPHHLSTAERYQRLRPLWPQEKYLLIPDIHQGKADWKIPPDKSLCVLVHSIRSNQQSWTVTVTDDTNDFLTCWIQPKWVQQEKEHPRYLVTGACWRISHATIVCHHDPGRNDEETISRILLVAPSNLQQVWLPFHHHHNNDDDKYDTTVSPDTNTTTVMMHRQEHANSPPLPSPIPPSAPSRTSPIPPTTHPQSNTVISTHAFNSQQHEVTAPVIQKLSPLVSVEQDASIHNNRPMPGEPTRIPPKHNNTNSTTFSSSNIQTSSLATTHERSPPPTAAKNQTHPNTSSSRRRRQKRRKSSPSPPPTRKISLFDHAHLMADLLDDEELLKVDEEEQQNQEGESRPSRTDNHETNKAATINTRTGLFGGNNLSNLDLDDMLDEDDY